MTSQPPRRMAQANPRRFGPEERFLVIGLAVVAAAVVAFFRIPALGARLSSFSQAWQTIAVQYGYFGALASALIGNLTILIIFPYTAIIFFLAAIGLNPFWLAIATGIGATIGELFSYYLGRTGSGAFARHRPASYEAVRSIVNRRPRLIPVLLFLFGALPLPDDLLLIPLGIVRYPVWKVAPATVIGKIAAALVITYTGEQAHSLVAASQSTRNDILLNGGVLAIIVVGMYIFFKVRWERVLNRFVPAADARTPEEPI